MELGKLGVFCFTEHLSLAEVDEVAQHTERLGYSALWYPEVFRHEPFCLANHLLNQTEKLIIATGAANIYVRDPYAARSGQNYLTKFFGGRYLLGLGVSHRTAGEYRGYQYGRPVAKMRDYLDRMERAARVIPELEESLPTVLAALGPRMIALAGERTHGAHPYNVTPEHTAWARAILGPDKWLCVEQKVLLVEDPSKARDLARQHMGSYLIKANYRNNWLRLGFSEDDLSDTGSDRFLDAMVAWGDESAVRQRIQEHFDAGASHVCIQTIHPEKPTKPDLNALTALAPEALDQHPSPVGSGAIRE